MATLEDLQINVGADVGDVEKEVGGLAGFVDDHFAAITAAGVAAGAGLEAFARGQADSTAALERTALASDQTSGELRDMAFEMSNATFAASDAADGMEELTQRGITTGEEFENILPKVDDLADATGMDFVDALESADRLLGPFGQDLNDVGEESDQMARLIAQTDVPLNKLEKALGRVPDELQGLEFGLDDAAAGLEVFRDRGFSGEQAVMEFREAVEASEGDMGAFLDAIGLTADEWAEYQQAVEPLPGLTGELAEANNDQMTMLERVQQNVENLMFKYGGLAEAAGMLAPMLMALGPIAKMLVGVKTLWAAAQTKLNIAMLASPLGLIIAGIAGIIAVGVLVIKNWDTVKKVAKAVFDAVLSVVRGVWDWIKKNWPTLLAILTGPIGIATKLIIDNWDKIKAGVAAVLNFIKNLATSVGNWFRSTFVAAFNAVRDGISSALSAVRGFFTGAWDNIRSGASSLMDFFRSIPGTIRSSVSSVGSIITSPFRQAFNAVARFWNNSVGRVSFSVPGWVPGIGGKGWSIPKIPQLAEGGVLRSAGSVMVGEEGVELLDLPRGARVTPLDRAEDNSGGSMPDEFTATATVDLGEGISQVMDIKFSRHDRGLKRRALAGAGAAR